MYWGDEYVPLRQVKIALYTYWQRAGKLQSYARVKQEAWVVIRAIVGNEGSRTTRERLHAEILKGMDRQNFDVDALAPLVSELLAALPNQSFGPYRFGANEVVDMMRQFAVAMSNYDRFTDGDFIEVRARHRQFILSYLQELPVLVRDPTYGTWFEDLTYNLLVNKACRDLMSGLGQKIIAQERGLTLPPVLLTRWTRPPDEVMKSVP